MMNNVINKLTDSYFGELMNVIATNSYYAIFLIVCLYSVFVKHVSIYSC